LQIWTSALDETSGNGALMIAIANGESLLPDVEDWMDREADADAEGDGNFVAFPQQAFRIRVRESQDVRPYVL
jgi:hypothetical protein